MINDIVCYEKEFMLKLLNNKLRKKILLLHSTGLVLLLTACDNLPFRVGDGNYQPLELQDLTTANVATNIGAADNVNKSGARSEPKSTGLSKVLTISEPAKPAYKTVWSNKKTRYRVKAGDNTFSVARQFKIKREDLLKDNQLQSNSQLKIGQVITINQKIKKTVRVTPPATNIAEPNRILNLSSAANKNILINNNAGAFIWPLDQFQLMENYGKGTGGFESDGLRLSANVHTPVRASRAGTVVYVGNGIKSLGLLLLIKHDNGYVSTYAHNAKILVKRGQTVAQGDVVAEVGVSGDVRLPQLYFEIRKNNNTINPLSILPPVEFR